MTVEILPVSGNAKPDPIPQPIDDKIPTAADKLLNIGKRVATKAFNELDELTKPVEHREGGTIREKRNGEKRGSGHTCDKPWNPFARELDVLQRPDDACYECDEKRRRVSRGRNKAKGKSTSNSTGSSRKSTHDPPPPKRRSPSDFLL